MGGREVVGNSCVGKSPTYNWQLDKFDNIILRMYLIQLFKLNQTDIDTNLYQRNEINRIKGLKVCDKNFTKARREINLSGN